jgi:hypothetical protein
VQEALVGFRRPGPERAPVGEVHRHGVERHPVLLTGRPWRLVPQATAVLVRPRVHHRRAVVGPVAPQLRRSRPTSNRATRANIKTGARPTSDTAS